MPKAPVYDMAGSNVGEIELSDEVFGIEPNEVAVHAAVKNYLANRRQGTQSALTKGQVSYTTRKPWRQKGTGRARAGYAGSPVWTHGGVAFAPKPRSYRYSLNKKLRRLALKSALSAKCASGEIIVIDDLKLESGKTRDFKAFLDRVNAQGKVLVITDGVNTPIVRAGRNLAGVYTTVATVINTYVVLNNSKIVLDKAALAKIEEVYA